MASSSSGSVDKSVDGRSSALAALAADLRAMHLRAGRPSTRAVAAKTLVSHDTVHRVFRCGLADKVPRWEALAEVVRALGEDPEQLRALWVRAVLEVEQKATDEQLGASVPVDADASRTASSPSKLPDAVLEPLLMAGTLRQLPAEVALFHQGDPATYVMVITSGHVKRFRFSLTGFRVLHSLLMPGQICGHEVVLSGADSQPFSVLSATEVTVVNLAIPRFHEVIRKFPHVATAIAGDLARQLEQQARIIQSQGDPPDVRIANILLTLASSVGTQVGPEQGVKLSVPLTQEEIGSLALVSKPTAQRVLRQLRERGLVSSGYRRLVIHDLEGLVKLTQPANIGPW